MDRFTCSLWLAACCLPLFGQTAPAPKVIAANVHPGATGINPLTTEIVVRFDRPMKKEAGSLAKVGDDSDPHFGAGSFDKAGLVYSIPVRLEAERGYKFTLKGFAAAAGGALAESTIGFRTGLPWADPRYVSPVEGIVYGEAAGVKLTMDYYKPSGKGPHPVAIIIHGGGFTAGTSRNGSEAYCADFLAPAGYAVFSINYRLYPRFTLADMVEDVHRAVRFIRQNASKYEADPNRIALVGGSAGGYLSNMAAVIPAKGAEVQAIVTLFGLSDMRQLGAIPSLGPMFAEWSPEKASPISHVSPGLPPFLFVHGDKDEAVPLTQSTALQAALKKAGVRADLIVIPNGPHGSHLWHFVPGVPDWEKQMTRWMDEVLKHTSTFGPGVRERKPKG